MRPLTVVKSASSEAAFPEMPAPMTHVQSQSVVSDFRDAWTEQYRYRELLFQLATRDLLLRYKQTAIGMVVFCHIAPGPLVVLVPAVLAIQLTFTAALGLLLAMANLLAASPTCTSPARR